MFLTFCSPIGSKAKASFFIYLLGDFARDTDAAGVGELLKSRCHIDTLAVTVVAFDDHFAKVDTDANVDALVFRD